MQSRQFAPRLSIAQPGPRSVPFQKPLKKDTSIQAKFSPDSKFTSDPNLRNAYALLNAAIDAMPESNVSKLRSSALVEVNFTAGEMTTSRAHTSIDVPDPLKGDELCPLASVAQWQDLKGRTQMDITINAAAGSDRKYFLQARTFAHELAAHVAPYIDILEKIKRGEGMSGEDRDRILTGGSRGGRGEHAGLVGGANREYDELVHQMARNLSVTEALQLAEDYLKDISRYDQKSGIVLSAEQKDEFIRQFNEARSRSDWIKTLYSESAARDGLIARRLAGLTSKDVAALILLAALVVFVVQKMFT